MNGRMYDPFQGRFLSPDPYVQDPLNHNRYAYCLNNPTKYTDPSGEIIFTVACLLIPGAQVFLPMAIAADAAWMSNYAGQVANNLQTGQSGNEAWFKNIDYFDVVIAAVIGGFTGSWGGTPIITNGWTIAGTILGGSVLQSAVDVDGNFEWEVVSGDKSWKEFGVDVAANTLSNAGSYFYMSKAPAKIPRGGNAKYFIGLLDMSLSTISNTGGNMFKNAIYDRDEDQYYNDQKNNNKSDHNLSPNPRENTDPILLPNSIPLPPDNSGNQDPLPLPNGDIYNLY